MRRSVLEISCCLLLIIGVLGDHASTMMVLSKPNTYEANPMAAHLIGLNLWLPIDIVLLAAGLTIPYLMTKIDARLRTLFIYPFTQGLLRLSMTIWNIHILLTLGS